MAFSPCRGTPFFPFLFSNLLVLFCAIFSFTTFPTKSRQLEKTVSERTSNLLDRELYAYCWVFFHLRWAYLSFYLMKDFKKVAYKRTDL